MSGELQLPLFAPETDWSLPNLSELPSWDEAKRVAIDVETCDPNLKKMGIGVRHGGYMVGVSFAIEDGPSAYLPFGHVGGGNLDKAQVIAYLRDQARVFRGDLVGAHLPYDIDYLLEEGVEFEPRFWRDVQVAEPLIDELQDSYALDAIAKRYGIPGKDVDLLKQAAEVYGVDHKKELYKIPGTYVGPYAERDVTLPLQLLRRQERIIDDQDLWQIYDLESRVTPALVDMRRRGVRIDFDRLDQVERWSEEQEREALEELYHCTGKRVAVGDVWKPEPLARALEEIGVEVPKTAKKGKDSITADWLATIDHAAADHIRRARKVNKLRTTFAASVRRYAVGDRLHCTFNQLRSTDDQSGDDYGARFGRLSSSDLNLQQQPARDPEMGPLWRSIYVPDEGGEWACLDFSQQEPRWLTHYAALLRLARAEEVRDRYIADPTMDNHDMMSRLLNPQWDDLPPKLRKKERDDAKQIFLGLCYGMGGAKLCRKCGLDTKWIRSRRDGRMIEVPGPQGEALLNRFHAAVPYVRQLAKRCEAKAAKVGHIVTVLGRRCRFPQTPEGGYDWTHKALNRLIQGSSADQTKAAMVAAYEEGVPLQLQVHDELDLTVWDRKEASDLAEIMRSSADCSVPHLVDAEFGPNWGQIAA